MYFEQFYLTCLSHASYMLGSEGIAAVVDPQRDVGVYIEEASPANMLHGPPGCWGGLRDPSWSPEDRQEVDESRLRLTRVGIEHSHWVS